MKLIYATLPAVWAIYHFALGFAAWTSALLVLVALLLFRLIRMVNGYPERRRREIRAARRLEESLWIGSTAELPSYRTKSKD